MVLYRRSNDVVARLDETEEGEIITFSAAGCEDDFRFAAVQHVGDAGTGALHSSASLLAGLMNGRGVAKAFEHPRAHGLKYLGQERRCGIGVHVNASHNTQFTPIEGGSKWLNWMGPGYSQAAGQALKLSCAGVLSAYAADVEALQVHPF